VAINVSEEPDATFLRMYFYNEHVCNRFLRNGGTAGYQYVLCVFLTIVTISQRYKV
jgi:hypothetical protein